MNSFFLNSNLWILSAPSGCGKTTLSSRLFEKDPLIKRSISATTRLPREGEKNGLDYFFMDKETFERKIKEKYFLEYVSLFDHFYGTPLEELQRIMSMKFDVLLTLDVQGFQKLMHTGIPFCSLFLKPPSLDALKERLLRRGKDSLDTIQKRLNQAEFEISYAHLYDYVVINDDFEKTVEEVLEIMQSKRHISYEDHREWA